ISFSSNPKHSLYNTAELIEGTSHDDRRSTSFSLGPDGWMLGPNRRLLFWVPPASREAFSYNPRTALVMLKGCIELDLSHMAHGTRWQRCRDE
ncbi:hypothetical protein DEU56DRAFT_724843, partial [Suillus clintonianus]|uniref:uncharacterized protein n=1 Tax=Suillus clintonianus TaxID=1904413 RepID=UPI001B85DEB2